MIFSALTLVIRLVISLYAILIGVWVGMPWPCTLGVGLMLATSLTTTPPLAKHVGWNQWGKYVAGPGAACGLGYLLFGSHSWDGFYIVWAALVTLPVLLAGCNPRPGFSIHYWRFLALSWALATVTVWLGVAYLQNDRLGFYAALFSLLVVLMVTKIWFGRRASVHLAANTAILLTIGVPLANLFTSPADSLGLPPPLSEKPYSYGFFKKDPAGYTRWVNYFQSQYIDCFLHHLYLSESNGPLTYRFRPGSQAAFFESRISINSKGFRGAEIPEEKKDAYRIVALGESTTFGYTLQRDAKPWPELLEAMIRERLKPSRPVQVINAGMPAYTISQNLYRLSQQILSLKPDLIISYHGYNGFFLVNAALPAITISKPPPAYQRRPLKILADAEYQVRLNHYKKNLNSKASRTTPVQDPMDSAYADAYRQLIQICRTNQVKLALSTYSMAVNQQSDADIIQFYHRRFLPLPTLLQANVVHSTIITRLAASNPDILFVDTHPGLDGVDEKFIDVMHFSAEGDQQMAETFFDGLKDFLVKDLARTDNSH